MINTYKKGENLFWQIMLNLCVVRQERMMLY
jgi:hypothetical protein